MTCFSVSVACEGGNAVKLFTVHAKMYSRFGIRTCVTMAAVTGGCCSVVLAASSSEESRVQWAYPSPYDDEDKEEEDQRRFTLYSSQLSLYVYQMYL